MEFAGLIYLNNYRKCVANLLNKYIDIGAHCHYDLCRQQTYLPFQCDSCKHKFCKHHRTQESHECINLEKELKEQEEIEKAKISKNKKIQINKPQHNGGYKCHYKKCKKYEWINIECNKCLKTFCLSHRSPDDHKCKGPKNNHKNKYNDKNAKLRKQRESFLNKLSLKQSCSTEVTSADNEAQQLNEQPITVR